MDDGRRGPVALRLRPCAKRGTEGASAASGTGSSRDEDRGPGTDGAGAAFHSLMGDGRAGTVAYFAPG